MVIIHSDQIAQQDGVYLAIGELDKEDEGEPKGLYLDKSQGVEKNLTLFRVEIFTFQTGKITLKFI